MKISRLMLSTHQGIGLLIGIQVVLWISGGVVMSVLPLEKVRGEDRIAKHDPAPLAPDLALLAPDQIAQDLHLAGLTAAALDTWLDRPVYRLQTENGDHLVDATTGEMLSPLNEDQARTVARRDYEGPGAVMAAQWLTEPLLEIRGRPLPLWRIAFDDGRHTTIYVAPQTGQVVGRRNAIWRVYDFFWMLHIMDYRARENFNHPWLVVAAVTAWLLATSGLWLVVLWLKRKFVRRRR
jgi:hypothetical protein